jgi:HAMP domain-containing protein
MTLRVKFNLVLLVAFSLGLTGIAVVARSMLQDNAREEILHIAGIMMEGASAIRRYTVDEIRPLLAVQIKREFLPQTVPAYAATRNIRGLREKYPEYTYKEATLNPTNPASRATDWEATVVEYFRNTPAAKELVGTRQTAVGPSLYMARPIQIKDESCLVCHGRIDDAPKTMLARYGTANGFGWKLNEIVGAQLVSVPMSIPLARAEKTFRTFMVAVAAAMAGMLLILNLLLHFVVIRPVCRMSRIAHEVSMGKLDAPECVPRGRDEIASLAESFNRMRRSLVNAMQMLNE